jgi:hypothetical protein
MPHAACATTPAAPTSKPTTTARAKRVAYLERVVEVQEGRIEELDQALSEALERQHNPPATRPAGNGPRPAI